MKATKTELKNKIGVLLRAAYKEPVIVTDRGVTTHVLMTIEEYERLTKNEELTPNSDAETSEKG